MKETSSFYKVLADEARLKMLWLLFHHPELCVCDFIEALAITQSKASRHLRILFRAGLVTDRRAGLWVYYAIRPLRDSLAKSQMKLLRSHLASRPDAAQLLNRLSEWQHRKGGETRCVGIPTAGPESIHAAVRSKALSGGRQR